MPGIGFWELCLVFAVAIMVYKPSDLGKILFFCGRQITKLQNLRDDFWRQYKEYLLTCAQEEEPKIDPKKHVPPSN